MESEIKSKGDRWKERWAVREEKSTPYRRDKDVKKRGRERQTDKVADR